MRIKVNVDNQIWQIHEGDGPLVAAAIHHGHMVRDEVAQNLALAETERLREEDPFTGNWLSIADTQIVVNRSRFEVDLNRPRQKAVYLDPGDAWGRQIWKSRPSPEIVGRSLTEYDAFYSEIRRIFTDLNRRYGHLVVFDLHSYNHRRTSPDSPPADPRLNPEVNIGTGTMERGRWSPLVDRFMADLRAFSFPGHRLDVRENIKFLGGHFAQWTHCNFPDSVCVMSIEFKKFFMDEWTGEPDLLKSEAIHQALQCAAAGVLEELNKG